MTENVFQEEAKVQREKMVARKESRKESRKNKKEKKSVEAAPSTSTLSASEKLAAIKLKRKAESEKVEKETRFSKETYDSESFRSLFTTHHSAKRSKDQISCWETPKIKTTQKCK